MAEEHDHSHIAVLRGRFTLLLLPPLLGNRINSFFFSCFFPEKQDSNTFLVISVSSGVDPCLPLQEQNQQFLLLPRLSSDLL